MGAQEVANLEQTLASVDIGNRLRSAGKRATIPETHAAVNPEAFAMMLESHGNLETYTELNAVALDLHEEVTKLRSPTS